MILIPPLYLRAQLSGGHVEIRPSYKDHFYFLIFELAEFGWITIFIGAIIFAAVIIAAAVSIGSCVYC